MKDPITTVGEMGMFNRHKRSASVEAIKQSKVLVIERAHFEYLLRSEAEMRMGIYQNIIEILSSKIVNDNTRARAGREGRYFYSASAGAA